MTVETIRLAIFPTIEQSEQKLLEHISARAPCEGLGIFSTGSGVGSQDPRGLGRGPGRPRRRARPPPPRTAAASPRANVRRLAGRKSETVARANGPRRPASEIRAKVNAPGAENLRQSQRPTPRAPSARDNRCNQRPRRPASERVAEASAQCAQRMKHPQKPAARAPRV